MTNRLTHLDKKGAARMVDVGHKSETVREAKAEGHLSMSEPALDAIRTASLAKGDALSTARIAGIMAAKRTSDLIPLCHPLPLSGITIDFAFSETSVSVTATVRTRASTGVEMEALSAATISLLTLYDMAKALDKGMIVENVRLTSKTGGASGDWAAS